MDTLDKVIGMLQAVDLPLCIQPSGCFQTMNLCISRALSILSHSLILRSISH